ncbi:MAG: hypothetical protein HF312_15590 [Ignavibacteria bacterium]|jgi:hypothetical protein|nr:hypothetical protein [Ignavibacteria bacterium]
MAWEEYQGIVTGEYTATANKGGSISFSSAVAKTILKDIQFCVLYVDKERQCIGCKPVDKDAANARRVRKSGSGMQVNAAGAISLLDLHPNPTVKGRVYRERDMVVVDFSEPLPVTHRARR